MAEQEPVRKLPKLSELNRGARLIAENLRRIEAALPLAPLSGIETPIPTISPSEAPLAAPHWSASVDTTGGRSPAQGQASS